MTRWDDHMAAIADACHSPAAFGMPATLATQQGTLAVHVVLDRERETLFTNAGSSIMESHWSATLSASALSTPPVAGDRLVFDDGRVFRIGPGPDLDGGIWSLPLIPE